MGGRWGAKLNPKDRKMGSEELKPRGGERGGAELNLKGKEVGASEETGTRWAGRWGPGGDPGKGGTVLSNRDSGDKSK